MRQVTRQEKKFLVDPVSAAKLRRRLSTVMHEDEHNGACGYRIRSLYFDTLHDRDFVEKLFGTDPRRKVRLRLYDSTGDFQFLVCKRKQIQAGFRSQKEWIECVSFDNDHYVQ